MTRFADASLVSDEFVPFRARAGDAFAFHAAEETYLRDSVIDSYRRIVWLQDTLMHLFRVVRECSIRFHRSWRI